MAGEKTTLSKVLSPMIEEYNVVDVLLIGAAAISIIGFLTPIISPVVGLIAALIVYAILHVTDYYKEADITKNGAHGELVEMEPEPCSECRNTVASPKRGYQVYYVAGYELFRTEQFDAPPICELCEREEIEESSEEERVEELA